MNYLPNLAIVMSVGGFAKKFKVLAVTLALLATICVPEFLSAALAEGRFREFNATVYSYGCVNLLETGEGECLVTLRSKISGVLSFKLKPTRAKGFSPKRHFRSYPYKHGRMNLVAASTVSGDLEFTFTVLRRKNQLFTLTLPRALIEDGDGMHTATIQRSVGYRRLACGEHSVSQALSEQDNFPVGPLAVTDAAAASSLDIWAVADKQFVEHAGGSADAVDDMQSAANFTGGVYADDLGITLTLETSTLTSAQGMISTNSTTLLNQFIAFGQTQASPSRDAALLFSGKDFDDPIIGVANGNAVCRVPSQSYGIIEGIGSSDRTKIIMAHELGHIVGHGSPGPHDSVDGFIMGTELQVNATNFSSYSINKILTYLATYGSCVTGDANFSATMTVKLTDTGKKQRFKFLVKPSGSGFSGYRVEIWGGTNCDQVADITTLTSTGTLLGTISGDTLTEGVNSTLQAKVNYAKKAKKLCFQAVIAEDSGESKSFTGTAVKAKMFTGEKPKSPAQIITQLAEKISGP